MECVSPGERLSFDSVKHKMESHRVFSEHCRNDLRESGWLGQEWKSSRAAERIPHRSELETAMVCTLVISRFIDGGEG